MRRIKGIIVILIIAGLVLMSGCSKKKDTDLTENDKFDFTVTEEENGVTKVEAKVSDGQQEMEEKEEVPPVKQEIAEGPAVYKLQILSVKEYDLAKIQQEMMQKDGYETQISEFEKDGEVYYRLRLKGLYSRQSAEKLGDNLKEKYWGISSYWVVKDI